MLKHLCPLLEAYGDWACGHTLLVGLLSVRYLCANGLLYQPQATVSRVKDLADGLHKVKEEAQESASSSPCFGMEGDAALRAKLLGALAWMVHVKY